MQRIDLHCHSTASDGLLSPTEVVGLAAASAVELFALTDHDTTAGVPAACEAADGTGVEIVPGVEVSTIWDDVEVHVIGLGIALDADPLAGLLALNRRSRRTRVAAMAAIVERRLRLDGLVERLAADADKPHGRLALARCLVESGRVKSVQQAFGRYLGRGRVAYVPPGWAALAPAVAAIRAVGGLPVLAHPLAYRLKSGRLNALVSAFRSAGGVGIEVVTGSMQGWQMRRTLSLAERHGLLASMGSDFHGIDAHHPGPGACSPLPPGVVPVWQDSAAAEGIQRPRLRALSSIN